MAIITKLQTQVKDIERCNLYLDGSFCCGISKLVVLQNRLAEGMEISDEQLSDLIFENDKDAAYNYATDYVCKYLPTQKQLTNKLYQKGYHKRVVDYVIEKCKTYGYINDLQYAQSYVFQNRNIKGKKKIEQELIVKGINKEIISEALEQYEENGGCLELAKKKIRNKDIDDPKQLASLTRFLQYRGYDWDVIKSAINKLKEEMND